MSQLAACLDISPNGSCHWGIRLPIPLFGGRRASPDACYKRAGRLRRLKDGLSVVIQWGSTVRTCGFLQGFRRSRQERVVKVVKEQLTVVVVVDVLFFP